MKIQAWGFILLAGLCAAACNPHKPAYANINLNQSPATTDPSIPNGAQNSASSALPQTPNAPVRIPAFMDPRSTQVKDLPNYPGARSTNIQYGPMGETDMFTTTLLTSDSTDKIAAFYDNAFKRNGWIVTDRTVDSEYCEWIMKKNESDAGQVIVKKDTQPDHFTITILRTVKSPPATPSTPPKS